MRILVTGASGLLGINLALEASRDHQVFGLVNNHRLHSTAFQVVDGDLLIPGTAERLLEAIQPDWVIHCAALANLDACEADPVRACQINTEVPRLLARLVARSGARLLHVSTDSVFDGLRGDYTEEDIPSPVGVYSQTKLAAEQAVTEADPHAIVARVNLFGYSMTSKRSLGEFFLYNLQAGKQVMGFTDVIFCPLLVNDLAQIFIEMLTAGLTGLYHVVSSDCISKYEFGVKLARRFSLDAALIQPTTVAQGGLKAVRSPKLNLRSDKLSGTLKHPLPTITSGLGRYYQLYQSGYPDLIRQMSTQA